jgi:diacylglycerol kinase
MTDPIQREIGKPKQDKDPNALKIASFRTKEGVWAEFCQKAEEQNLTATDVLKAAMDQFISGEYNPRVYATVSMSNVHHDVLEIVNTAIEQRVKDLTDTALQPITQAIEDLRSELSEISDKLQNSQKNINKKLVDK